MRLVLYTLENDKRKAESVAGMEGDIFKFCKGGTDKEKGSAVRMSFKEWERENYFLDGITKDALSEAVGSRPVESVVFMMHAYPGKLCPQKALCGHRVIESTAAAWSLQEARDLLRDWDAKLVYFLCCQFGLTRQKDIELPFRVPDGPTFIARGLNAGATVFAATQIVEICSDMPILRKSYYQRQVEVIE